MIPLTSAIEVEGRHASKEEVYVIGISEKTFTVGVAAEGQEEIYNLARQSYFAEKEIGLDKNSDEFLHTENFILIDGKGRIRGVYNGTLALEMTRLITDIKTLKKFG